MKGRRVLLIENFSSDFYKARLPLAKFLIAKGWEVYALIPRGEYAEIISQQGITVVEYELFRKDKGIKQLLRLIQIYKKVIKENDIDIIHSFRFQPNLLNVLSNLFNRRKLILHITGLGIAFSNSSIKYLFLRFVSQVIFQIKLLRADRVIVQNFEDKKDIWLSSVWDTKVVVINGSGVNIDIFNKEIHNKKLLRKTMDIQENELIYICVTRLIWEKGIKEMVDAFVKLRPKNLNCKLWIVGWSDMDNPRHVKESYINSFQDESDIIFFGKKENIIELLAIADVFIYPSYYREGIPRSLLEALSMSLPIITTNMPGCNLTVKSGLNGFLITPRSTDEIITAVENMTLSNQLSAFGKMSRQIAVDRFSDAAVFSEVEKIYQS